jgi:hypothetical protein
VIDFENLNEFTIGIKEEFDIKMPRDFCNSVCWTSLVYEDYLYYDLVVKIDYTKKNVFYVILGHLILKYSGKYIFDNLLYKIIESIKEVEINYKKLELTEEEQLEILNLAKQVKIELPKLKIFTDADALIELEKKEYLESQQK